MKIVGLDAFFRAELDRKINPNNLQGTKKKTPKKNTAQYGNWKGNGVTNFLEQRNCQLEWK